MAFLTISGASHAGKRDHSRHGFPCKTGRRSKRSAFCGRLAEAGYWVAAGVGGDDLGEVGEVGLSPQSAGD